MASCSDFNTESTADNCTQQHKPKLQAITSIQCAEYEPISNFNSSKVNVIK